MKRNLRRLIDLGELRRAMELSLELMKQGSYQDALVQSHVQGKRQVGCIYDRELEELRKHFEASGS